MKDAMHDWMDALPKAAVDELLKAKKKLTDEKMLGKSYLETLKKYNIKPLLARAGDHRAAWTLSTARVLRLMELKSPKPHLFL